MNINPVQPYPITEYNTFGLTVKRPVNKVYYPNCWNEVSEGKIKDYSFMIYNNYQFGRKCSTLIILKKLGSWIKSKLKYIDIDGNHKVLWSYNKNKKGV